jgi:cell division protease FtsH
MWDRVKILLLLAIVAVVLVGSRVQPPFVPLDVALREFFSEPIGLIIATLFVLEILRQIHYLFAENSAAYFAFWENRVIGGWSRLTGRVKPWTRFRIGRFVRWGIYTAIYAYSVMWLVPGIETPVQAIAELPRILIGVLSSPEFWRVVSILFLVVAQFAMIFWFLSRGGTDILSPEEVKTRFTDVWGQDHVLNSIKENIAFLERPDEIEEKGGYIPGGMLLWGPPGTGKTLIAESIAGETGRPYVFVDPGAFINMFMGVGIIKVKSLYRKLRKLSLRHGGVIVFFDEADSLGSRGAMGAPGGAFGATPAIAARFAATQGCNGIHYLSSPAQRTLLGEFQLEDPPSDPEAAPRRWRDRIIMGGMGGGGMGTLQALLTEMNGLTKPRGMSNRVRKLLGMRPKPPPKYRILHIMATNMPNALDPAMLRPGRIDRVYKVGYPSKEGRKETLVGYLNKVSNTLSDEEIEKFAVRSPYATGASIKDMVNEALIIAIRDGRTTIAWDDLWRAKALKEVGPPDDAEYVERERHAVAIHEASHAVAAHLLRAHAAIDIATIERRGDVGGFVSSIPEEDRMFEWRSEYEVDLMVSIASLAGERMFFEGDNSAGVGGDMRSATSLAAAMEGTMAMGDTITSFAGTTLGPTGMPTSPVSAILGKRGEEVEARLQRLYQEVWELLDTHRPQVLAVAAALEEKRLISGDDVAEIVGIPHGSLVARRPAGWSSVDPEGRKALTLPFGDESPNGGPNPNGKTEDEGEPADETPAEETELDPVD